MLQNGACPAQHGDGNADLFPEGARCLFRFGMPVLFRDGTAVPFRNGTSLDGDHRGLPLGQAAAPEVDGQDVDVRTVALVRGEVWFGASLFAGGETAVSVEDAPLAIEDDGLQQPVLADVVGEGIEIVLVEPGEKRGGGMGFDVMLLAGGEGEELLCAAGVRDS
ncbi:hypothetical protein [Streptomyces uncialis]